MTATEFIQSTITEFHNNLINDVKVLTQENLAWKPAPTANPIGFLFWHITRTEDNIIQGLRKQSPIWESENWYKKLGMDAKAHGTGFQEAEVARIASLPLSELMAYAERVTQSTTDYLESLDDTKLDDAPDPERPQRTIGMLLRNVIIAHGWGHLGEIRYVKGMQGMPASR